MYIKTHSHSMYKLSASKSDYLMNSVIIKVL